MGMNPTTRRRGRIAKDSPKYFVINWECLKRLEGGERNQNGGLAWPSGVTSPGLRQAGPPWSGQTEMTWPKLNGPLHGGPACRRSDDVTPSRVRNRLQRRERDVTGIRGYNPEPTPSRATMGRARPRYPWPAPWWTGSAQVQGYNLDGSARGYTKGSPFVSISCICYQASLHRKSGGRETRNTPQNISRGIFVPKGATKHKNNDFLSRKLPRTKKGEKKKRTTVNSQNEFGPSGVTSPGLRQAGPPWSGQAEIIWPKLNGPLHGRPACRRSDDVTPSRVRNRQEKQAARRPKHTRSQP